MRYPLANLVLSLDEEWKCHPYIKDLACSSNGRLASISKKCVYSGSINNNGYLKLCLHRDGKMVTGSVHRLVAETFIGISSLTVNHINGNKLDNRPVNLEYMSIGDNVRHAIKTGLRNNRSVSVHNSSVDVFGVLTIATLFEAGFCQQSISNMVKVSRPVIGGMVSGRTYKDFNYLFSNYVKGEHGKYSKRNSKKESL